MKAKIFSLFSFVDFSVNFSNSSSCPRSQAPPPTLFLERETPIYRSSGENSLRSTETLILYRFSRYTIQKGHQRRWFLIQSESFESEANSTYDVLLSLCDCVVFRFEVKSSL
ncbi:hypothetical protein L6452_21160 [Arctium lappa]|uniref:Uncharacterized protein n=1 Tax=Arctium lappa TaxID=4217 RepID=A0ACB9BCK5_ARCLA|nr:hypothetical protein L6452_21160 [Arctium lappa]